MSVGEHHLLDDMANQFNLESLPWPDEEYLFRHRIPKKAIVCCLSLATLAYHGLYQLVPELQQQASVEVWKEMIIANWK